MFIGITLLYKFIEGDALYGALKSYTIDCIGCNDLQNVIHQKVEEQLAFYPTHEYLGIEDIYTVSGKASKGEMLGRTSYFELKSEDDAYSLLENNINYLEVFSNNRKDNKMFNAKLLYYYSAEDLESSFVFSLITIVEIFDSSQVKEELYKVAESDSLKNKIADSSLGVIDSGNIVFIGVEDFAVVEEDIQKGGAYYILYNRDFATKNEIESILPEDNEIEEMFIDVFK